MGKTTLQKAIMGWQFEEGSKATFAVNSVHHKKRYKYRGNPLVVDYEIFDTPGLDRFRDIITLYLRGALAVIVGYDKIILIANKIDIEMSQTFDNDDEKIEDPGNI